MKGLRVLSAVLGWSYFVCWTISFFPQAILNYRRKSVVGMSFEYQLLNLIGFSSYAIYCCSLVWNEQVRRRYKEAFHSSSLVTVQDACFALWATLGTLVTISQIFIYERGAQRFSPIVLAAVLFICVLTLILGTLVIQYAPAGPKVHEIPLISFLAFLYWLSVVKLAITFSKYFPQAILNYKRKSTVGWSITNVLLDFSGGLLSVLQLLVDGASLGWSGLAGDPIKFALGFFSMFFDIVFILQHYVFYHEKLEERMSSASTCLDPQRDSFAFLGGSSNPHNRTICSRLLSTISEEDTIDARTTINSVFSPSTVNNLNDDSATSITKSTRDRPSDQQSLREASDNSDHAALLLDEHEDANGDRAMPRRR